MTDPTPTDVPPLPDDHDAVQTGAVTTSGAWIPPVGPGAPPTTTAAAHGRRTLEEWLAEYDYEKNPHPYVDIVKAIPMGGDRVPMNHSMEVLNLMAIHLARMNIVVPPPEERDIKYVPPEHGPNVAFNPGSWVDIDEDVPEAAPEVLPDLDFTGVPEDQLAVLKRAIAREEARKLQVANADPGARDEALARLAAAPTMDVVVTPQEVTSD